MNEMVPETRKYLAQRRAIVLWRSVVKTRRAGLSSSLHIRRR